MCAVFSWLTGLTQEDGNSSMRVECCCPHYRLRSDCSQCSMMQHTATAVCHCMEHACLLHKQAMPASQAHALVHANPAMSHQHSLQRLFGRGAYEAQVDVLQHLRWRLHADRVALCHAL